MAQALWEQGKDGFSILSTTYFTISNKDQMSSGANGYQKVLEKFNNSLTLYRELGGQQSVADLLTWMAAVEIEIGSYVDALNYLKESQGIYDKLNSRPGENAFVNDVDNAMKTMALFVMGRDLFNARDYKSALKKYKMALRLSRKLGKKRYEGGLLWEIGEIQLRLGNHSDAERYDREALVIFRNLGKKNYEARMLCNIARAYLAKDENSKSLEYLNKALEIFEQFDDKNGIMAVLFLKGRIYYDQNDKSKSLAFFKKALEISQDVKYQEAIAEIAEELGSVYKGMGHLSIPVEYYEQALSIIHETGDSPKEGDILYTIGQLYGGMGDYKKALVALNKAMLIYIKHDMDFDRRGTLVEIGKANSNLGNYLESIDNLQEALKIFEGVSNSDASKKVALNALGSVYRLLGDEETAKEYDLENKGTETPDKKDKWDQLSALEQQVRYFIEEHKEEEALSAIRRILNFGKGFDGYVFEAVCLRRVGFIYKSYLKDYSKALDYYEQAQEVSRTNNDKAEELANLLNIAKTYDYPFLSDYLNALDYYKQALIIANEIGDKPSERKCLSAIGEKYFQQKKYEKAEEFLKKALFVSLEMGAPEGIWDSQNNLGHLAYNTEQLQKARSYYGEAINTIESIREKISVEELKTSFIEDKLLVYSFMIFTLLELEEDEEAFNYVERAKSRALLDLLGNKIKLKKGNGKELSQEERKLQRRITELLEKVQKEQSQPKERQRSILTVWNKELKKVRKRYSKLLLEMKRKAPELHSLAGVNPLDLNEVQVLIEPDTTLLVYYIYHNTVCAEDTILCWVVNKNELFVYSTGTVSGLFTKINTLREKITNRQPDYDKEAKELYDLLIRPVKPYIKTQRIGIIPHSVLHYLPFQALINADATINDTENRDRFLVEEYDIFYAPSASVLKFVFEKRRENPNNVLVFGNPELGGKERNLHYAEVEAEKIKECFPDTSIYLNNKATEEKAKQLSGKYDIIHFACHAELNPQSPIFSCIKMVKDKNEDGRLEVHEIFNLDLENTSLVTLSACETGLGKLSKGDELIGLTRGFIYAGAPSIVASLWNVNDQSTSDLMSFFYKNLKTYSKVESLRMAQLEMINGEVGRGIVRDVGGITSPEDQGNPLPQMAVNGSHPFFWAPFILLGDWK